MTIDDIRLLFEYDRWANDRAMQQASTLTAEQFTKDLGGSFASVRDALLHILGGQWIWLQYCRQPSPSLDSIAGIRAQRDAILNPAAFPSVDVLRSKWMEVEKEVAEFVGSMTSESLKRPLPVRTTELELVQIMQHVGNHSTYHRGQLALMMRQLGAEPLHTDFHVFLVERGQTSNAGT